MFRGINSATLDPKGRMALPARFREIVAARSAGALVVTIDTREKCLLMYPLPDWEVVQTKLEGLSNIGERARLIQRLLIGHATDIELDGNGRLLLPPMLRTFADLDRKLVLVGQGNKIEIWSETRWQARMGEWLSPESGAANGPGDQSRGDELTGLSL